MDGPDIRPFMYPVFWLTSNAVRTRYSAGYLVATPGVYLTDQAVSGALAFLVGFGILLIFFFWYIRYSAEFYIHWPWSKAGKGLISGAFLYLTLLAQVVEMERLNFHRYFSPFATPGPYHNFRLIGKEKLKIFVILSSYQMDQISDLLYISDILTNIKCSIKSVSGWISGD